MSRIQVKTVDHETCIAVVASFDLNALELLEARKSQSGKHPYKVKIKICLEKFRDGRSPIIFLQQTQREIR